MNWGWLIPVIGGLVAVWLVFIALLWVFRPRNMRLGEAIRIVPDVLRLGRDLFTDRTTPLGVRIAIGGLVLWLLNPIDLIPEFIPILGPLDDVVVAVLVLRYARRRLGQERLHAVWRGTPDGWQLLSGVLG